ncbi:hypothetical protein KBK19_12520 [Microvirga sp. STR05]|uniref:Anti-sigma factor n=1 Tax=Hymenobacter duratus TaxID=2771356 RepID=A0ABR8JJR1_9BACT|nr:hypothetical protein [Hymenobacter duratus]MBD2715861.1 hypothetical protein [Hymenobacter duratus]MBR7950772.1 hypothetical protein [Microvirga sp. STR05]
MSQTPDTPETGREHLRRALHHLPTHEPAAATWPRILAQLTAEEAVTRTLPHLPTHEPDDALWNAIAARLDAPEETPVFRTPDPVPQIKSLWPAATLRWVSGVAAAVLMLLAAWLLRPAYAPQALPDAVATTEAAAPLETIAYSEEVVTAPAASPAAPLAFDPLGQQGVAFIDAHCTSLPTVCQSDEFQQLRSQLSELETEEQSLRQDVRRFGSTPELVQHQVHITTLKATVTRELIQLLIS